MTNIFDFKSYKSYLVALCESERGALTRFAEAAGCQKSYLSTCLKGKGQLTLDHAFGISEQLQLSDQEQEYLFVLVEKEKAATLPLRRRLENKAKEMARESFRLKNQQRDSVIVSEGSSDIGFYYATWLPTALHTLSSVPGSQTQAAMAKRLNLHPAVIASVLDYLEKMNLVKKAGDKYLWSSSNIHLADNSAWIAGHHSNWRFRAVENIQKSDREATHYSAIQSFSEEDFEKLKRKILDFIKEFNKTADPSEPEEAFCLNIDLFRV